MSFPSNLPNRSEPALAPAPPRADPVLAFALRCQARAYLWTIGEFPLTEAVDVLQADAERGGLIKCIGQDAVQQIMAAAFRPYRGVAL